MITLVLILSLTFYFPVEKEKSFQSIVMEMHIEKKDSLIEPGKYIKMWVIGSNTNDTTKNKTKYKVMIDDSRIYNLIEEGKEYFVSVQGSKEAQTTDYIYTFGQIGIVGGTQLAGKGKIE